MMLSPRMSPFRMSPHRRAAFTLVELLVVVGLLSAFLGLTVVGLRPTENSQVRQLSQLLSSAILATQTRAVGSESGSALILDVPTGGVSTNAVFNGDVPPVIVGTVSSGMPPSNLAAVTANVSLSPSNADPADLASGFRIRFLGTSPAVAKTPWMGLSSGTVTLRSMASQTTNNTVWPIPPAGGTLSFEVARLPTKSAPAFEVLKRTAIDLRYSGVGNTVGGNFGSLDGKGSIGITFDRLGALDTVILLGMPSIEPLNPTAPLYLLIATVSDIESNTSLRSQTSRWLAIAPGSGRVNVSANVPVAGTTQDHIDTARSLVRQAFTRGVR